MCTFKQYCLEGILEKENSATTKGFTLRVTDLEVIVADHETRLTVAEENIEGRASYACQFYFIYLTQITVNKAFTQLQTFILFSGLQMTAVDLQVRITTLEEYQNGNMTMMSFIQYLTSIPVTSYCRQVWLTN